MRLAPRLLIALALGLTAAFVAACGGSSSGSRGLLSQGQSATISTELSTIADAVDKGACRKARAGLSELDATLRGLPSSVNQRLVHNLGQGAATTRSLAMRDCARAHTPTTTTTTTTTATTSSVPTTQTPTQTPTQTQTQTETQTETQPATTTGQVGTGTVTTLPNAGGTTTSPGGGNPGRGNAGGNGGGNGEGHGGGNGAGGLNPGGGG